MEGGDLSNEIVPRLLIEFEGLLAHPETLPQSRLDWLMRIPPKVRWELDDLVVKVMWDLSWRLHQEIDVITEQGPEFAETLSLRLSDEQVPARRVWGYQPRILARRLATMPYVAAVYTAEPQHALLYGSRGRLITPETIPQIGRF